MTTTLIRQKLYDYIRVADTKKVKAIYTMLEENIEETFNHWNDEKFVAELQSRSNDYKTGKVKGIAWENAKKQILSTNKAAK
jgi:putative addiction module component (TIGR02574 family)